MASATGMHQRSWRHDYCAPSFYMITIVTAPRRACLSALCGGRGRGGRGRGGRGRGGRGRGGRGLPPPLDPGSVSGAAPGSVSGAAPAPELFLTPIGETILRVWRRTSEVYAGVEACECVVMPDHFHGILWVKERQPRHVGHIVKAFKRVSEHECRCQGLLGGRGGRGRGGRGRGGRGLPPPLDPGSVSGAAPAPELLVPETLWQSGYQDTILLHKGQLRTMVRYIADNPRRLAAKRANPELFTVVHELAVAPDRSCPGIGNRFLLDRPVKRQVQVSRSISPEAFAAQKDEHLYAASHGAVLVSPCISPGEKEIAHAALESDLPLIVLLENGFHTHYKPPGRYFDACAAGRLLMLAPFPYHRQKRSITREQCLTLNEWAETIVTDLDSCGERLTT